MRSWNNILHQKKKKEKTESHWFYWDCAAPARYRIGLVANPPPLCSVLSTLCRSSMTTSAMWKEAFRQHVVMNYAFATEGPYLLLSPCHVRGLFCIEWVSDASHHKNIQLQLLLALVLVPLQLLQILFLLAGGWRARAGRTGAAAAAARR